MMHFTFFFFTMSLLLLLNSAYTRFNAHIPNSSISTAIAKNTQFVSFPSTSHIPFINLLISTKKKRKQEKTWVVVPSPPPQIILFFFFFIAHVLLFFFWVIIIKVIVVTLCTYISSSSPHTHFTNLFSLSFNFYNDALFIFLIPFCYIVISKLSFSFPRNRTCFFSFQSPSILFLST